MKILVLGGGISPERPISLRSAKAVADAAKAAGYETVQADPADGLEKLEGLKDTIIFPILHGKNGEDGTIQKELEARNLPYLGSDSAASIACFDKWTTRLELLQAGVDMPKAALVDEKSYGGSELAGSNHVLKIVHGGSSIGTLVIKQDLKDKERRLSEIFAMEDKAVIEELVQGIEITVPVLDGKALPAIEIVPPADEEFDYDNKYNGRTLEIVPARSLSAEKRREAEALAEKVHQVMGARHLSRVDMIINKNGRIFVLEINTMPGLTEQSLYPKSAKAAGVDMPGLIVKFADLVKRDYKIK